MSNTPTILWLRNDLRLRDNPALDAAVKRGRPIIPVFIWSPDEEGDWPTGGASKVWLYGSLCALNDSLHRKRSRLIVRSGKTHDVINQLIHESKASAVYWNRRYEPFAVDRDARIKSTLKSQNVDAKSFNSSLLFEPWEISTQQEQPYKVFTPFWKACTSLTEPDEPSILPNTLRPLETWPASVAIDSLGLLPSIHWHQGIRDSWTPGEVGAHKQLKRFVQNAMAIYSEGRNIPGQQYTSRMSPYLHFGEISPRQIWHEVKNSLAGIDSEQGVKSAWCFLREIGWREFAYHLLYHFPHTTTEPLRPVFKNFPWNHNSDSLQQWQRGETGYPIIDAGMRELWTTGWMHNRVRMVVASFLVKNLLLPWQDGAQWFWDTLVDADLANNTLGWQWTAGCGADAAPFFRIFNPVSQGEKFDHEGHYVRMWVPEIKELPDKWLHKPWEAPDAVLSDAGIKLGRTYPQPIVDHKLTRHEALEAYQQIKGDS